MRKIPITRFSDREKEHIEYTLTLCRDYMKERARSSQDPHSGLYDNNEEHDLQLELESAIHSITRVWALYNK